MVASTLEVHDLIIAAPFVCTFRMTPFEPRDFIRIYRHLVRLCKSFPDGTMRIRDVVENTSKMMMPYNARGTLHTVG